MPTQDNSPKREYVRWYDTKLVYNGFAYKIKDGHTNKKYIFWSINQPDIFQFDEILPLGDFILIFININGTVTTYPSDKGIYLDSINKATSSNSILYEHIANSSIHNTEYFKKFIESISMKLENAILRIEELEKNNVGSES